MHTHTLQIYKYTDLHVLQTYILNKVNSGNANKVSTTNHFLGVGKSISKHQTASLLHTANTGSLVFTWVADALVKLFEDIFLAGFLGEKNNKPCSHITHGIKLLLTIELDDRYGATRFQLIQSWRFPCFELPFTFQCLISI